MISYRDVATAILARIEAGEWAPGAKLPTTKVLAQEYGVSESTAYYALRSLRDQGLIRAVQGGARYVPDGQPNGDDNGQDAA